MDAGERFQVKRLMVTPGHSRSLQRHPKRAEHWGVVSGTARVTRGDETQRLILQTSVASRSRAGATRIPSRDT